MNKHFLTYLEDSVKSFWNSPVVTDYDNGRTLSYGQFANEIYRLHVLFQLLGLKKGDKVALCSSNCANWALSFMAVSTYEGVVVSILPDFQPESIQKLVNHSEAKLLIASQRIWQNLDFQQMPGLSAVLHIGDFSLLATSEASLSEAFAQWDEKFKEAYPKGIAAADVSFPTDNWDDLCLINYTSGTTSVPKGVMLSYRSISSNTQYGQDNIPTRPGDTLLSMLPLAHMFGLAFEFIYPMAGGCHIYFLNRTPSPKILLAALKDVKPYLVLTVPLVIEKIFKNAVFPAIHKPLMRVLWNIPGINCIIRRKLREKLLSTFGGKLRVLIIGGAALSGEVEDCLKAIRFPYTVGYGMTECGPIIGYCDWKEFRKKSCGQAVDRMEVRIDSARPDKEVGEILVRGANVMMGYYKNEEATRAVFKDGWMCTGDMGIIDSKGNIFIKGRCKNMLLGASGQNIYPEEIEDKLNTLPMVVESIVVQRDDRLVGLVFPDYDAAKKEGLDSEGLAALMQQNAERLNRMLPAYSRIHKIELVEKEFEKTPKRSIKRFLYR